MRGVNVHGTEATKLCRGCGRVLPLDAFYPNHVAGGVYARCKECSRAAAARYRAEWKARVQGRRGDHNHRHS